MELIERSTWDDDLAATTHGPWERGSAKVITVGDYPDEPDLVVAVEGGDGRDEFVAWLEAHINATEDPVRLLAYLVRERDDACPCCPGVEDETWGRARKLIAALAAPTTGDANG